MSWRRRRLFFLVPGVYSTPQAFVARSNSNAVSVFVVVRGELYQHPSFPVATRGECRLLSQSSITKDEGARGIPTDLPPKKSPQVRHVLLFWFYYYCYKKAREFLPSLAARGPRDLIYRRVWCLHLSNSFIVVLVRACGVVRLLYLH